MQLTAYPKDVIPMSRSFAKNLRSTHVRGPSKVSAKSLETNLDSVVDLEAEPFDGSIKVVLKTPIALVPQKFPSNNTTTDDLQSPGKLDEVVTSSASPKQLIEKEEKKDFILQKYKAHDPCKSEQITFKWKVFFEFVLYHVIFLLLLGPLGTLILWPFVGKQVLKNMLFWGFKSRSQTIVYLLTCSSLAVYVYNLKMTTRHYISAIEIVSLLVLVTIRITFVCCKYAYSSPQFIKIIHSRELTDKEIMDQVLFGVWFNQKEEIINELVQESILRLRTDLPLFYFTFLGHDPLPIENNVLNKQSGIKRAVSKYYSNTRRLRSFQMGNTDKSLASVKSISDEVSNLDRDFSQVINQRSLHTKFSFKPSETIIDGDLEAMNLTVPELTLHAFHNAINKEHALEKTMLSGYSFATELIAKGQYLRRKRHIWIILIISLIRGVLPTMVRIFEGQPAFGKTTAEYYLTISLLSMTSVFFLINYLLASISVIDMKTRLFMLSQLSHLIPGYSSEKDYPRYFPPLNVFNPVSLRFWQSFHELISDYGSRYQLRHTFNVTIYLLIYVIQFAVITVNMLGLTSFDLDPSTIIIGGYEVLCVFSLFVILLVRGAQINSYFDVHKSKLLAIKSIMSDMKSMRTLYFGKDAIVPDCCIKRAGVKYFKDILNQEYGGENLDEEAYIEKCCEKLEQLEQIAATMIEMLDNKKQNNAFTILSVRISYQIIWTLFVGIISLSAAVLQVSLNKVS